MSVEQRFLGVYFVPLDASGPMLFGFPEFLAGLALMVLAWTIADVRYRFRVSTAPIPLQGLTFGVVATVGVLILLTDLWRAEEWLVPRGNLLTPALWQAILAGLFFLTFITWAWFAFLRPPAFSKHNARRFARTLYRFILRGSPSELAVIADELTYSARPLVRHATDRGRFKHHRTVGGDKQLPDPQKVGAYANVLLLLIAHRRFCKAIVESSPMTALALFQEMGETGKYGIQIETFARNIVNQALANKDSFLYHEAESYESGLIGYHKPLSHAMFANYEMVETVDTMLDPDIQAKSKWDADQWKVYCRLVLMTFQDYVDRQLWNHSFVLYRAIDYIEHAASDLYKLNGLTNIWDNDALHRLRVVVEFIKDAIKILDEKGVPDHIRLRVRKKHGHPGETFYDHVANMIFEVILAASKVRSPQWECWTIQHNSVWSRLFNFNNLDGPAGKVVKFKVRRLLYDAVSDMNRLPNHKGATILGFCLNVMGLDTSLVSHDRDSRALHKAVLTWTKRNYACLHASNPRVAEACLVDGITYDIENLRLFKTDSEDRLRRKRHDIYLEIDPATEDAERPE